MHKDDKKWVQEQLMLLSEPMHRQEVLSKYNAVFKSAFNTEPLAHRKDGSARFEANNRLRIYIKKVTT